MASHTRFLQRPGYHLKALCAIPCLTVGIFRELSETCGRTLRLGGSLGSWARLSAPPSRARAQSASLRGLEWDAAAVVIVALLGLAFVQPRDEGGGRVFRMQALRTASRHLRSRINGQRSARRPWPRGGGPRFRSMAQVRSMPGRQSSHRLPGTGWDDGELGARLRGSSSSTPFLISSSGVGRWAILSLKLSARMLLCSCREDVSVNKGLAREIGSGAGDQVPPAAPRLGRRGRRRFLPYYSGPRGRPRLASWHRTAPERGLSVIGARVRWRAKPRSLTFASRPGIWSAACPSETPPPLQSCPPKKSNTTGRQDARVGSRVMGRQRQR